MRDFGSEFIFFLIMADALFTNYSKKRPNTINFFSQYGDIFAGLCEDRPT